jgi:ABC-2 type transport system ATP-binding protein
VIHTEPRALDDAVVTHGLFKRYGRASALEQVDLRVPDGAVYVLVGANGAGKSTLFKVLMNLERPDAGTAKVFGLDTGRAGPEVRAQVGYVPERQDAPYRSMTCARLLRHAAAFYPEWDDAYADHLARALGVRRSGGRRAVEGRDATPPARAGARVPASAPAARRADGRPRPGRPSARAGAAGRAPGRRADHRPDLDASHPRAGEPRGPRRRAPDGRLVAQMPRDELQRTVRSYQLEVPDGWEAPRELQLTGLRRSSAGRDVRCTLVGEEREVTRRLAATGARVRQVSTLALEDAALAFLPEDPA